jgi:hypothetical protein
MAAGHLYVDVAAARIQHYLGRTPRLKGHRGASARLSWATDAGLPGDQRGGHLAEQIKALGAEPNPEAGQADGLVSMRLAAGADARAAAETMAGYLRELLPAAELTAIWGTGASYLEAYRDQMKSQRDDPPLASLPAPADFPALASCAECRAAPAVGKIDIHEKAGIPVCLDCCARYQDRYRRPALAAQPHQGEPGSAGFLPIYREEAQLADALRRRPVGDTAPDFGELAALGAPDTARNHIATVYVDGNAVGAFFDQIAAGDDPDLKAVISAALSGATRAALREAARAVLGSDPASPLPVIPHVVGGDDLVVSVVADRAWAFTTAYLQQFSKELSKLDLPGDLAARLPTASAGLVLAHAKFPFRRAAELAGERLSAAKRNTPAGRRQPAGVTPAVAWLDVTRDGEHPPSGQRPWSLAALCAQAGSLRELREKVEPSGRAVLGRLLDPASPEVSLARLRDHARRLDRAEVLEPFLRDGDASEAVATMAEALALARWWR